MKHNLKLTITPLIAGLGLMLGSSPAFAQHVLVNEPFNPSDPSNIAWADSEPTATTTPYDVSGGSFTIGGSGNYVVKDITVWEVANPSASATANLSLLGGIAGSTISPTSPVSTSYSSSDLGALYSPGGAGPFEVYKINFAVDIALNAAQTYDFFLNAPYAYDAKRAETTQPYVNAFLLGAPDNGGNNTWLWLDVDDPANGNIPTVQTWYDYTGGGSSGYGPGGSFGPQNDNADVEVYGHYRCPDGGSALMLLGSSLAGLAFLRRRFGRC
jgi:hypothetical protein